MGLWPGKKGDAETPTLALEDNIDRRSTADSISEISQFVKRTVFTRLKQRTWWWPAFVTPGAPPVLQEAAAFAILPVSHDPVTPGNVQPVDLTGLVCNCLHTSYNGGNDRIEEETPPRARDSRPRGQMQGQIGKDLPRKRLNREGAAGEDDQRKVLIVRRE